AGRFSAVGKFRSSAGILRGGDMMVGPRSTNLSISAKDEDKRAPRLDSAYRTTPEMMSFRLLRIDSPKSVCRIDEPGSRGRPEGRGLPEGTISQIDSRSNRAGASNELNQGTPTLNLRRIRIGRVNIMAHAHTARRDGLCGIGDQAERGLSRRVGEERRLGLLIVRSEARRPRLPEPRTTRGTKLKKPTTQSDTIWPRGVDIMARRQADFYLCRSKSDLCPLPTSAFSLLRPSSRDSPGRVERGAEDFFGIFVACSRRPSTPIYN
ncbi:hypothetical protein THAOC_25794, partial [Thalassiosira oceanica]